MTDMTYSHTQQHLTLTVSGTECGPVWNGNESSAAIYPPSSLLPSTMEFSAFQMSHMYLSSGQTCRREGS